MKYGHGGRRNWLFFAGYRFRKNWNRRRSIVMYCRASPAMAASARARTFAVVLSLLLSCNTDACHGPCRVWKGSGTKGAAYSLCMTETFHTSNVFEKWKKIDAHRVVVALWQQSPPKKTKHKYDSLLPRNNTYCLYAGCRITGR